jgi:hypothetical protein
MVLPRSETGRAPRPWALASAEPGRRIVWIHGDLADRADDVVEWLEAHPHVLVVASDLFTGLTHEHLRYRARTIAATGKFGLSGSAFLCQTEAIPRKTVSWVWSGPYGREAYPGLV